MDFLYLTACLVSFLCAAGAFKMLAKLTSAKVWSCYWVLFGIWALGEVGSFALWKVTECSAPTKYVDDVKVTGFLSNEEGDDWVRQQLNRGFSFVERREGIGSSERFVKYRRSDANNFTVAHASYRDSKVEENYSTEFVRGSRLALRWEVVSANGKLLGRAADSYYYGSMLRRMWASAVYPELGVIRDCLTISKFQEEFLIPKKT